MVDDIAIDAIKHGGVHAVEGLGAHGLADLIAFIMYNKKPKTKGQQNYLNCLQTIKTQTTLQTASALHSRDNLNTREMRESIDAEAKQCAERHLRVEDFDSNGP